jgi:uncharacterized protein YdhG (YjbR/CyaY superfamily)
MNTPNTVDDYISGFPGDIQRKLKQLRAAVKKAAPAAEEVISYGMPYYRLNGRLLYFAAHKNHIGFYPLTTAIEKFKSSLADYKWAKGTIQFPLEKPLPLELISKMVKFRVNENLENAKMKIKRK